MGGHLLMEAVLVEVEEYMNCGQPLLLLDFLFPVLQFVPFVRHNVPEAIFGLF